MAPTAGTTLGPPPHDGWINRSKRRLLVASPLFASIDGLRRSAVAGLALGKAVVDYKLHGAIFPPIEDQAREQHKQRTPLWTASGAARCAIQRLRVSRKARLLCRNDEELRDAALKQLHQRTARKMLRVCWRHGGVYTKLGQYVSTLCHVLPAEITEPLGVLAERAKSLHWDEVKPILDQDFGPGAADRLFSNVERLPVAAASLAQVHRAIRRSDGRPVALKVQYPHLQQQTAGDLRTLEVMTRIVARVFPSCDFCWIVPEFQQNHSHEIDFRQEAFNAVRARRLLSSVPHVRVPEVFWETTSRRCLAMEFVDGVRVTDEQGLEAEKIDREALGNIITQTFGELIFKHGVVHCDPHPGNLLARRNAATGETELVLLDHGMYRRICPDIREVNYVLWSSLFLLDKQTGLDACARLGLPPKSLNVLSMLLMSSGWGETSNSLNRDELAAKLRNVKLDDANNFFRELPRDFLWILRTINLLRCITARLGQSKLARSEQLGSLAWKTMREENLPGKMEKGQFIGAGVVAERVLTELASVYRYTITSDSLYTELLHPEVDHSSLTRGRFISSPNRAAYEFPQLGPLARQNLEATNIFPTKLLPHHFQAWRGLGRSVWECIRLRGTGGGRKFCLPLNHDFAQNGFVEKYFPVIPVPWYLLSGAATLNLPVDSELRMYYEQLERLKQQHAFFFVRRVCHFFQRLAMHITETLFHMRYRLAYVFLRSRQLPIDII